jgi:hypothetical protein
MTGLGERCSKIDLIALGLGSIPVEDRMLTVLDILVALQQYQAGRFQ